MKTECDLCGEELILSPTGHQWCADYKCKNGMGVPFSPMLLAQLTDPPCFRRERATIAASLRV
jgi:hypothetical protein